jgi:hypothetical protein
VQEAFNAKALLQRADIEALNGGLADALTAKGLEINVAETESFRAKLRDAGFYGEWRAKIGDEAWALLEGYAGKLG